MVSVVLVEPETPGNIGAVARVMKNFGARHLILVNPKCSHLSSEAFDRASHAKDILEKATVTDNFSYLKKFDYVIGTTAALGSDYNVMRSPITPEQLAQQLQGKASSKIAVVFGRESSGLTNSEISSCDLLVTIPASTKYRALNLSHAVTIILYELFSKSGSEKVNSHIALASRKEKDVAIEMFKKIRDRMDYPLQATRKTQAVVWSRLVNKSFLTKREMNTLLGFLRKVSEK